MITHELKRTGAPLVLLDTCRALAKNNYEMVLIAPQKDMLSDQFERLGVKILYHKLIAALYFSLSKSNSALKYLSVIYLPIRVIVNILLIFTLYLQLLKLKPDIVLLNSFASRFAAIPAKLSSTKVLWHIHEVYNDRKIIVYALKGFAAWCSDYILVASEYTKSKWIIPRYEKKFIIAASGGVYNKNVLEVEYSKRENDLVFVGRFTKEKGFHILLDSLRRFNKKSLKIAFVGNFTEVSFKTHVGNFIRTHLSFHQINFFIEYPDPLEIIGNSKILVLPSRDESFGRVIIEAMSCKTAVIATKVGGIPEIIKDNISGLLIEIDNDLDLFNKLNYLLENGNIAQKYAENAYQIFLEHFTLEKYFEVITKIFLDVLEKEK